MRRSTRLLAALLSILMLCGLLPFSLFAAEATDGDVSEGSTETDNSGKTYAELVAEYVSGKNGKLYFANDFSGLETTSYSQNTTYGSKTGGSISSLAGGIKSLSLIPKDDVITVGDGALYVSSDPDHDLTGTNTDPFLQVDISEGTKGATLVSEVTFKIADEGMGVGIYSIMFSKEYINGAHSEYVMLRLKSEDVDGVRTYTYYTGSNVALKTVKVGEAVNFKVVQSFANGISYYYVDGEYVTNGKVSNFNVANYSDTTTGVPDPTLVRFGHLGDQTDRVAGLYLDDIYVYTADVPYGCKSCYGDNYIESVLTPYLSANGGRILGGSDFENATATFSSNVIELKDGVQLWDRNFNHVTQEYTYELSAGTQWTITSATSKYAQLLFHDKLTTGDIKTEDGNTYLSVEQNVPLSSDAYLDTYQTGYKVGTDFVTTISLRRHADTNWGLCIISYRWNDFGKGEKGTAADGSTATSDGHGTKWVQSVFADADGRIYVMDYASGSAQKVYVGQLYSNEFTQISVAVHPSTGLADIYINGYKIHTYTLMAAGDFPATFEKGGVTYTYDDFSVKDFYFLTIRSGIQYSSQGKITSRYTGGHDIDNAFFYTGTAPAEAKADDEAKLSGWVQDSESGYWRYYTPADGTYGGLDIKAGVALKGEQTVDGTVYYFENSDAYVSRLERTSIFDLYKLNTLKDVTSDTRVTIAGNIKFGPSTTVKGSGKWTYLWADMYKDPDNKTAKNAIASLSAQGVYKYNNDTFTMQTNSALTVTKETSKSSVAARLMSSAGKNYIDLTGYAGIELVLYADIVSDFGIYFVVSNDGFGANTPGYVNNATWNKAIWNTETQGEGTKPANYSAKYVISASNKGWNTQTFYFENYKHATDANGKNMGLGRIGTNNRIVNIDFSTNWSNIMNEFKDYDTAKIYLDNMYAVKYTPVTEIPAAGLITTEEGTYNYSKTYMYETGWSDVDGNGADDHYFFPYSGLMATGLTVIDGVGVLFDDEGVLVDETATGRYTVNGIDCIYVDGVLQTGAFTYEGVNYFASPSGRIFSEIGAIGYEYDNAYSASVFEEGTKFLISQNFNSIDAGTVYGNYSGSGTHALKNDVEAYINLAAKLTHFTVVKEEEGNNAIEITNNGGGVDSYININLKTENALNAETGLYDFTFIAADGTKLAATDAEGNGLDIVFEYDVKLGSDWNADATAFQPINVSTEDGGRKNNCAAIARINTQGYLYTTVNGAKKLICKLSNDTYTNLAYVINADTKTCDVYVNGVKVIGDVKVGNQNYGIVINEARLMQYPQDARGTAYIDNINVYLASTPVSYTGATAAKSGWVTEGGIQRYYQDGLMCTSALKVEGADGIERYYYFDADNGMCTGTAQGWVSGVYYIDGVMATSQWINDGTQYVDENGKLVKGGYLIDGTGYYFNTSTGILEQMIGSETVIADVKDILNYRKDKYTIDRSNTVGGISASANLKGFTSGLEFNFAEKIDSTKYDAIKLDIYLGDSYDADYGIKFGNPTKMVVATDVVASYDEAGNVTGYTSATVTDEFLWRDEHPNYFVDTSKYLAMNGVNYRVHYHDDEEGNRTYYFQHMAYYFLMKDFNSLEAGWNTVIVELDKLGKNNSPDPTAISNVSLIVSGWSLNGGGDKLADGAKDFDVRVGNISFITYADIPTEAQNGWIDGKYYDSSVAYSTGWIVDGENTYYSKLDGTALKAGTYLVDGFYYTFSADGVCQGKANGEIIVNTPVNRDGVWVNADMTMFFVDGVAQSGVQTAADGNVYICDEDGIALANASMIDGNYIYQSDASGVATKLTSCWYTDANGDSYYLRPNGKMYKNSVTKVAGVYYSFGATGAIEKNVLKGDRYFGADGAAVSGVNTITVDGEEKIAYFNTADFCQQKSYLYTDDDGNVMWFAADGYAVVNAICDSVVVGEETKTAYFNENGILTVPEDHIIDGVEYTFDENGYITGTAEVDYGTEVASGVCGPELTWVYYDSKTLVISGNGAMNEYSAGKAPWNTYKKVATSVVIEEGVVSVGQAAFYEFSALSSVQLPSSLILIGQYAFFQCKALTSLEIPANVASIGYYAFRKCGFKTGGLTFKNTEGWVSADQSVVTDAAVTEALASEPTITGNFFVTNCTVRYDRQFTDAGETIASGKCGKNLTWTMSANGVLTVSGTGEMYKYSAKTMPWVAYKSAILKIVIEEGVTTIGNAAFYEANNVISVSFPSTLTSIGNYSFFSLIVLDELTVPENVTYIGRYAFRKLKSLESFKLEALYGWTAGSQLILSKYITDPVEAVEILATYATVDWTRDPNASAATEDPNIVVSGTCGKKLNWKITKDGTLTISGTGAMSEFASDNMPTWYENIDLITSIVIEEGVTTVGKFAFYFVAKNTTITSVSLPSTLTSIGKYAFFNCKGITEITIPAAVTSIGDNALRKTASSITFENTYGWSAGTTAIDAEQLADPATAANLIHAKYYGDTWTCVPDGGDAAVLSGDASYTANY